MHVIIFDAFGSLYITPPALQAFSACINVIKFHIIKAYSYQFPVIFRQQVQTISIMTQFKDIFYIKSGVVITLTGFKIRLLSLVVAKGISLLLLFSVSLRLSSTDLSDDPVTIMSKVIEIHNRVTHICKEKQCLTRFLNPTIYRDLLSLNLRDIKTLDLN